MLASTVQFSNNKQKTSPTPPPTPNTTSPRRNHQHRSGIAASRPHKTTHTRNPHPQRWEPPMPVLSGPNSAPTTHHPPRGPFQLTPTQGSRPTPPPPTEGRRCASRRTRHHTPSSEPNSQCSTHEHTTTEHSSATWRMDPHPQGMRAMSSLERR